MKTWESFLIEKEDQDLQFRAKGLLTKLIHSYPGHLKAMITTYFESGKADSDAGLSSILEQILESLNEEKPDREEEPLDSEDDTDNIVTPPAADRQGEESSS